MVSSVSSVSCENPDTGKSFSCSLNVKQDTTLVVVEGCLGTQASPCDSFTVTDSLGDNFTKTIFSSQQSCNKTQDPPTCYVRILYAENIVSVSANDTLSFTTNVIGYSAAEVFDVSGIQPKIVSAAFGSFTPGSTPAVGPPMLVQSDDFVVAGVVGDNAVHFTPGSGYTLIQDQPCLPCGQQGGWLAAEYESWPNVAGNTSATFGYPSDNDGWAEISAAFAPAPSATSVMCTPSPVPALVPTTCTAKVTGGNTTGTVSWNSTRGGMFSSSMCTLTSASCSVEFTASSASPVTVNAYYGGDSNLLPSMGNFTLVVGKAPSQISMSCSPPAAAVGSSTTCTASVSGASPSGTITWASNSIADFAPGSMCTLSAGACAVSYTPSSVTSTTITAIYSGDANNNGSSATFPLSVTEQVTSSSTTAGGTTASASNSSSSNSSSASASSASVSSASHSTVNSVSSSSTASSSSLPLNYLLLLATEATIILALAGWSRRRPRSS